MAESKSQHFRCHVCLEVLKSPKILPCLHTFCQQCIHEIILSTVQNKEPKPKQFACPVCHTVVKPRDPTTSIEKWASLLQDNTAVGTAEMQECHTCKHHNETSVASFWCKDCHEAFCEKCNTMHGWVKLTSSHNVIPIDDANYNDSGIDLKVISEKCWIHPFAIIEAFCSDHEELCCVLCLTSSHRECKIIKALCEITETKRGNETFEEVLQTIKLEMEKLLEYKEKKTERLNESVETIEEDASKFVQKIKCKLDDLFGNFIKQMRILQNEQYSNLQADAQFLRDFMRTLEHWIKVTEIVRKFGTETQFFIHSKTMITQIKENIRQYSINFSSDFDINLFFSKNDILKQVVTDMQDIGITTAKTIPVKAPTKELYKLFSDIGITPPINFHEISVKHICNIYIRNADFKCGVSIDDNHAIVGAKCKKGRILYCLNIKTGDVLSETVISERFHGFKCLCFDKESNHLFIADSGFRFRLLMAEVSGYVIKQPLTLSFGNVNSFWQVDTMAVDGDYIYVMSGREVQKFEASIQPTVTEHVTLCYEKNMSTTPKPSGLAIHDGKFLYISSGKEVKCLTIQGNELFSFESASLKSPGCLTVTPSGVVMVVDRAGNGSLHAISSNGKDYKILLRKFDTVSRLPVDIWTDDRGEIICVCGGQEVEVYKIETE